MSISSELLVVMGANGRTGRAVLREAALQGRRVRILVQSGAEAEALSGWSGDIQVVRPDRLRLGLQGATHAIAALAPRHMDDGGWRFNLGEHLISAAVDARLRQVVWASVVGATRFSRVGLWPHLLEQGVRRRPGPWSIARFSCFHDEVYDAHVHPPDQRAPHIIPPNGRYAPCSRDDGARILLHLCHHGVPGTTVAIGGPAVYDGLTLSRVVEPWLYKNGVKRTPIPSLPDADLAVTPEETRQAVGLTPGTSLERWLDAQTHPERSEEALIESLGPTLVGLLHDQLLADCARIGVAGADSLDFSTARAGGRRLPYGDGTMMELSGVQVHDAEGARIYTGNVAFDLKGGALKIWWAGAGTLRSSG